MTIFGGFVAILVKNVVVFGATFETTFFTRIATNRQKLSNFIYTGTKLPVFKTHNFFKFGHSFPSKIFVNDYRHFWTSVLVCLNYTFFVGEKWVVVVTRNEIK